MNRITRLMAFGICLMAATAIARAQEIAPGPGVGMPVVSREVKPDYTPEAKQAGIEGLVEMSVVVNDDGTVGEVKVTKSLDQKYGLDDQAVSAMKKWLFKPGTKDGKPVAVRVSVEMTFRLK
jgi:periplasmic protein TonB